MGRTLTNVVILIVGLAFAILSLGCSSQDVPQAHKGRMFDKTGALAFYAGGKGFEGPVLGPGTYYTGIYPEVRMVDCSQQTPKEQLVALTKNGVQFGMDIYVRFSANCDDDAAVSAILSKISPAKGSVITADEIYGLYVRPALGEAVRESISPHNANDINDKREEIYAAIGKRFAEIINRQNPKFVSIYDLNLNNMNFPAEMVKANTERAVQAIYKDKAIAERERVTAEIETAGMRKKLAENEGDNEAGRIDRFGAALRRNPEYLQFNMQSLMPDIYKTAGEHGNMIIAAPSPNIMVNTGSAKAVAAPQPPPAPAK